MAAGGLPRRRLDLPGLRRARRESRPRAELHVEGLLRNRAGRLLFKLYRHHQTPSPAVARIRRDARAGKPIVLSASISTTHSAPTATVTEKRIPGIGITQGESQKM